MYIRDPLFQATRGYLENGNNQPLLVNIGKCLQYMTVGTRTGASIRNIGEHTLSAECLKFLLDFLELEHYEIYSKANKNPQKLTLANLNLRKIRDILVDDPLDIKTVS